MIPDVKKTSRVQNDLSNDASSVQPDLEYVNLKKISENQYEDPRKLTKLLEAIS